MITEIICNPCTTNCNQGRSCPERKTMNERTAHAAMDEAAEWAAKQDARMRKAFPHKPLNDLQREFAPGVIEHQRAELSRSERFLTVGIYLVSAGIAIAAVVFIVRNAPDFVLTAAKICG